MSVAEKLYVPLLRLGTFGELAVYAKSCHRYPTGSIKYRTALRMIEHAESTGELQKGMEIIEATSGNTGIALAYIGKEKSYPVTIVTGRGATKDSKRMIEEYGGGVVHVDGWFSDCLDKVRELMSSKPEFYFWTRQTENPASLASNMGLGYEIAEELTPDIFIASAGTGSTITGVGRALKENMSSTKVYLVVPEGEFEVAGVDDPSESSVLLPLFDQNIIDFRTGVSQERAIDASQRLYRMGHPVGISAGAVFAAAEEIGQEHDGTAVIIFPDHRNRYTHLLGE